MSNVIKYLHRLMNLPNSSPMKWVYNELCYLDGLGFEAWVSRSNSLLKQYQSNLNVNIDSFANMSHTIVKPKLKKASWDTFVYNWYNNVNEYK